MPRRPVFTSVMQVVERRVAEGDYMLKDLPGERKLAQELGVSYLTARKAVAHLIEKRILSRKENGALIVNPQFHDRNSQPQVVMLTPAYPSPHLMQCQLLIWQPAERFGVRFRPVEYMHWHDPIVSEALRGSDGLLVIPSTEPLPPSVTVGFTAPSAKVVFFDDDMTDFGIPSIRLFSEEHIGLLFGHLFDLGHRRIDCLNAQGRNIEIDRRIGQWQQWITHRKVEGKLWDVPVPAFADPTMQAYTAMKRALAEGAHPFSALVCTTQPAALGVIRACYEQGLRVGQDISVCTINNEPSGWYFCPSLTGLELPDVEPLIERCFLWFAKPNQPWKGDLCLVPKQPKLFLGESTGKPAAR